MRQVRYSVAMSLDGYIAGPNGEADWIVMDPAIDFGAIFSRFDTLLFGRKTYAAMQAMRRGAGIGAGVQSVVISHTMRQADFPDVTIVNELLAEHGRCTDADGKPRLVHRTLEQFRRGSAIGPSVAVVEKGGAEAIPREHPQVPSATTGRPTGGRAS
jgi:RibD C-terminal domain